MEFFVLLIVVLHLLKIIGIIICIVILEFYLNKIHNDLFEKSDKIIEAPSWRLLQKFGGNLNIQDFRDSFNKIEYINTR